MEEYKCPCGKKFWVNANDFSLAHELPMCEQFNNMEPDKFLYYVNEFYGFHELENKSNRSIN